MFFVNGTWNILCLQLNLTSDNKIFSQKALLILDNAPRQPNEDELNVKIHNGYIEIMFIPAVNTTVLL